MVDHHILAHEPSTPGRYYFHGRFLGNRLLKGREKRRRKEGRGHDSEENSSTYILSAIIKKARKISPVAEGAFGMFSAYVHIHY